MRFARLETRIPPMVVLAGCAALAWLLGLALPGRPLEWPLQWLLALVLLVGGVGLSLASKFAFLRADTTLNPMRPEHVSTLVTTGLYRWTRNPMYLGQAVILLAWAVFVDRPVAFLVVPLFVAYITRFQIHPEEMVLSRRFPGMYAAFCERTRRWI